MTTTTLGASVCYSGSATIAKWEGRKVADVKRFKRFVREIVRPRVRDADSSFAADLQGLATTGMATQFVEQLLSAVPDCEGWEVGEALAECALQQDPNREIHWPWNTIRDRRTPRASLPGTDLVGFCREKDGVWLLFGEVKTSSDVGTPPGVMYGGSGMTWQLEQNAVVLAIQRSLLQWLRARCQSDTSLDLYKKAVGRYLESGGRDLLLVGVLLRDVDPPSELDLRSRAQALAKKLRTPTRVELLAFYLPVPIGDWPQLVREQRT